MTVLRPDGVQTVAAVRAKESSRGLAVRSECWSRLGMTNTKKMERKRKREIHTEVQKSWSLASIHGFTSDITEPGSLCGHVGWDLITVVPMLILGAHLAVIQRYDTRAVQ